MIRLCVFGVFSIFLAFYWFVFINFFPQIKVCPNLTDRHIRKRQWTATTIELNDLSLIDWHNRSIDRLTCAWCVTNAPTTQHQCLCVDANGKWLKLCHWCTAPFCLSPRWTAQSLCHVWCCAKNGSVRPQYQRVHHCGHWSASNTPPAHIVSIYCIVKYSLFLYHHSFVHSLLVFFIFFLL